MKPIYPVQRFSRCVAVGLVLSGVIAALPARAATFGFIPVGLDPIDDYQQVYGDNALHTGSENPIDAYQSSVTEAANDGKPGINTPLEQALAEAGYNPTILQAVVSRALSRVAGLSAAVSSGNVSLSAFEFDANALSNLITDAEGSALSSWKVSNRCRRMRTKLRKDPGSIPFEKQARCWNR
jgi:hypothetical protein